MGMAGAGAGAGVGGGYDTRPLHTMAPLYVDAVDEINKDITAINTKSTCTVLLMLMLMVMVLVWE